jgi:aspartate/methionine/tyrosine aminotransferase
VQRAAAVALRDGEGEVAKLRAHLRHTREVLVRGLTALPGVEVPDAGGAMYVFFRIAGHDDTLSLAKQLVAEAGLGLAPGGAFGPEGEGWLRWCHAVAADRLEQGLERLRTFLGR